MKLSVKLPMAVAAALFAASAAGLFGIHRLDGSADTYARVIRVDFSHERQAASMLVEFKTQVQEWKDTLLRGKDPKQLEKYWGAFQEHEGKVQASAKTLVAALPQGEAQALVTKFAAAHSIMGERYRAGFNAFKAAGFESAAGDAAVKGMDREPAQLLNEVAKQIVADSTAAVAMADQERTRSIWISTLLMIAFGVLGTVGAVVVVRRIVQELGGEPSQARELARQITDGNLAVAAALRRGDSSSLMATLDAMRLSLSSIVGQMRASSDSVATASAQIAQGNNDLSQRTEEQASALEETAASMEELSSTVKQNADNARQANQLALSASTVAVKGGDVVGEVVDDHEGHQRQSPRRSPTSSA